MRILRTLLLMLLPVPLFGQTLTLVDVSTSDSPLTLKGTISFDPGGDNNKTTCSITEHNNAAKAIVAFRQYFDVVRPNDNRFVEMRHLHDHFFKDQSFMVNMPQRGIDLVPNDLDCPAFFAASPSMRPSSQPPSATVRTVFVQFEDGSVWGDNKEAAAVMFQRTEAVKYLQSLKAAYAQGGDVTLSQALNASVYPTWETDRSYRGVIRNKRFEYQQLPNAQAVADRIDKDLANAQARAAWLK
jgi:hypothetical protein